MNSLRFIKNVNKFRHWPAFNVHRCISLKGEPKTSNSSKRYQSDEEINNEPIQFFGSQAASWRAKDTRSGGSDEHLWFQPYVISGSLAVFLIYFCVLREQNDIDLKLEGNLFQHIEGLEEVQLTMNYKYNKENGLDNTAVIQRLQELGIDVNVLDGKIASAN